MHLDVRTVLVLRHPDARQVLLLRRSPDRTLFPGRVTGLGGAVELGRGEGADLEAALWREVEEESALRPADVAGVVLRLVTLESRGAAQVVLLWFLGQLRAVPADLSCSEGELFFLDPAALPAEAMIPTARAAIDHLLALPPAAAGCRAGAFGPGAELALAPR